MAKIYLPTEFINKPCKIVQNGYIRVYNTTNQNTQNIVYDVYVNQDYQVRQTTATYNSNTQCDNFNQYTDNFYYRLDLSNILLIFLIFVIFIIYLPIKIFSRLFKKGSL